MTYIQVLFFNKDSSSDPVV
uniref:Uncharacterized protein n=1 Tax=Arundo donax TaxID=35708 RepID=A0A0A9AVL1_ARUDO